jgi:hypothetical protein
VHLAFPTRRSVALLAASTVGLSTALLSAVGAASAATLPTLVFDTDPSNPADPPGTTVLTTGATFTVPAGYCSVDWVLTGAPGGMDTHGQHGAGGTEVDVTTPITGPQTYTFVLGAAGTDAGLSVGGTGGVGGHGANGTDGANDGSGYSGGGGGATTVDDAGALLLEAPGGNGYGAFAADGKGGGTVVTPAGTSPTTTPGGTAAAVRAVATPCPPSPPPPVPAAAPVVTSLQGGEQELSFELTKADSATVTGTEYSFDGGTTWTSVAAPSDDDRHYDGTITGLVSRHTYSVSFRFLTSGGPGDASAAKTAAPLGTAPTHLSAVVGGSSITISWDPPVDPTGVTGYQAVVLPGAEPQSDAGMVQCPAMGAGVHSCRLAVPAGTAYSVSVAALSPDPGVPAFLVSDVVPAPAAPAVVPAGDASLHSGTGPVPATLTAGQKLPLSGSGFAPGSTVSLYLYSTPTLLGTVLTDATGSFSTTVTLPAGLAPGAHHLVAVGVDASVNARVLRSDVTVPTPAGQLAWTGFEATPFALAGGLAVLLGIVLVVVPRRRRTA